MVLDLTEEGSVNVINLTENPGTGTLSGSVEYLDDDGVPVALGHFHGVDDIIMPDPNDPDGPDDLPRDIDFDVEGQNPAHLPPKADLEDLISTISVCPEEDDSVEDEPEDDTQMESDWI